MTSRTAPLSIAGIIPFSATDWPGRLTATLFTQGCPWKCTYCHNSQLQPFGEGEHSWDDVVALLEERKGLLDGVVFSGGDPLAQRGLGDAIAAVHDIGYEVGLHTTGYLPTRLRELVRDRRTRPEWIGIDIKGLVPDMPDIIGCTLRGAQANWVSVRYLSEHADELGIDVQVRTTIPRGSVLDEHLPELQRQVAAMGVTLVVQYARPVPPVALSVGIASHSGNAADPTVTKTAASVAVSAA